MEEVFGVVYLIQNQINGKRYVGKTTQTLQKRMKKHLYDNLYVDKSIQKYGIENFRYGVIKTCATEAELNAAEKHFIAVLYSKDPYGYNLTDGGDRDYTLTDKTRTRLSAASTGRHPSAETCAKISATSTGVPKSPEHCAAISAGSKGKFIGEKNHRFGTQHTKTACYTISVNQRGDSPFKNLLAELDAHQLTYAALAKLMGFASASNLTDKMHCRKKFTERDKVKLVEIFGKPIEYLLERDEDTNCEQIFAKKRNSPYKNLLAELDARHLSYTALAKLLGLSLSNISMKMNGKLNFTERDKAKLVEIFGKPIAYLLARDE